MGQYTDDELDDILKRADPMQRQKLLGLLPLDTRQRLESRSGASVPSVTQTQPVVAPEAPQKKSRSLWGSVTHEVTKATRPVTKPVMRALETPAAQVYQAGAQVIPGKQPGERRDMPLWENPITTERKNLSAWQGAEFPKLKVGGATIADSKMYLGAAIDPLTYAPGVGFTKLATTPTKALEQTTRQGLKQAGKTAVKKAATAPIEVKALDTDVVVRLPRLQPAEEVVADLKVRSPERLRRAPKGMEKTDEAINVFRAGQEVGENTVRVAKATLVDAGRKLAGKDTAHDILQLNDRGIIQNPAIKPKAGQSLHWHDVFSKPDNYEWADPKLRQYRNVYVAGEQAMKQLADDMGIPLKELSQEEGEDFIGRVVIGKWDNDQFFEYNPSKAKLLGAKTTGEKARKFETAGEAVEGYEKKIGDKTVKVRYQYAEPEQALEVRLTQIYNRAAQLEALKVAKSMKTKVWSEELGRAIEVPLFKTPRERMNAEVRETWKELSKDVRKARREAEAVKKVVLNEPNKRIGQDLLNQLPPDVQDRIATIQGIGPKVNWQMTSAEFQQKYRALERRVSARREIVEKTRKVEPLTSPRFTEDWEAFSKAHGYTAKDIEEFRAWLSLNKGITDFSDITPSVLHRQAVASAIDNQLPVPSQVLKEYPDLAAKTKIRGGETPYMMSPAERQQLLDNALGNVDQKRRALEAFKPKYRQALLNARTATGTEGTSQLPALRGSIISDIRDADGNIVATGRDVAEYIGKQFEPQVVSKELETASKIARAGVTLTGALDVSWAAIQGAPVLAHDMSMWVRGKPSTAWFSAVKGMAKTIQDPAYVEQFMTQNSAFLSRHPYLLTEGNEFFEGTGMLVKAAGKLPGSVAESAVKQTYGRLGASFNSAGMVGRMKTAQALELAKAKELGVAVEQLDSATLREIDEISNALSGVISSRVAGVSAKQRAMESSLLFAPRYIRANLMVMNSLFRRGGLTGAEARWAIGTLVGGMVASYVGISKALGQEPHLNPMPKDLGGDGGLFLTFDISEHHVGIPGAAYGFLRLAAGVSAAAAKDPAKLISLDFRNNPTLNYISSRGSPLFGVGREIVEGRDFMGNKIDGADDWASVAVAHFIPIMMQDFVGIDAKGEPKALFGDFIGMRTYPKSDWEKREQMANRLLAENGDDRTWAELPTQEKKDFERKHLELKAYGERIEAQWEEMKGTDFQKAYTISTNVVKDEFNKGMESLAAQYTQGFISMAEYNDQRGKLLDRKGAGAEMAMQMKTILDNKSVKELQEWIDKNQKPEDKAMDEYQKIFREPVKGPPIEENGQILEGLIDWGSTFKKAESYLAGLDAKTRNYIKLYEHNWILDLPETAKQVELKRLGDIEMLRPYWEIPDNLYDEYSQKMGSQNVKTAKAAYEQAVNQLYLRLRAEGATPQVRSSELRKLQYQFAPRVTYNGRVTLMDQLIDYRKQLWQRDPKNREAVMALGSWYAR